MGVWPTVDERLLELARVVVEKVAQATVAATAMIRQRQGGAPTLSLRAKSGSDG